MVAVEAEKKGLRLSLTIGYGTPDAIIGDNGRLRQILVNLISNAIKFTPERGRITVRTRASAHAALLVIEDSGIGIPKSALAKIGKPFEQVESQFTKTHKGSGLGLAIAKSLVELHGGTMRIRSEEGAGTAVVVRLPVDCQPVPVSDAPQFAALH